MNNSISVLGVHPIPAREPVHLIEIEIFGALSDFDFGEVTQVDENQPMENWQIAYDERDLESGSTKARFAFFFHYLDLHKPLSTPFGFVHLPKETSLPPHLVGMKYEES